MYYHQVQIFSEDEAEVEQMAYSWYKSSPLARAGDRFLTL